MYKSVYKILSHFPVIVICWNTNAQKEVLVQLPTDVTSEHKGIILLVCVINTNEKLDTVFLHQFWGH